MGLVVCCRRSPNRVNLGPTDLVVVASPEDSSSTVPKKTATSRRSEKVKTLEKKNTFAKPTSQDVRIKAMDEFAHADTDKSGDVSLAEIRSMLFRLNAVVPKAKLKVLFEKHDAGKRGALSLVQFTNLLVEADERPELVELFMNAIKLEAEKGSGVIKGAISPVGLHYFYAATAPTDAKSGWTLPSVEECAVIIKRYSEMSEQAYLATGVGNKPPPAGNKTPMLTLEAFSLLMTDLTFNGPASPDALYKVYQDMDQPLSHYYINSSHNTYLSGNQLNSASSADSVRSALLQGVRVIELDAWDASSGVEPIVNHGRTLCTPVSFASCVRAIAECGFVASQYPVILTIENHCTGPFQESMAKILFEHLNSRLFRFNMPGQDLFAGPDEWVSPAQLRGKVVLRDKPKRLQIKHELKKRPSLHSTLFGSRKSQPKPKKDELGSGKSIPSDTSSRPEDDEDDFIDEVNEEEGVGVPLAKVEQEARKISLAVGGSVRLAVEELGLDAVAKVPWLQSTHQMMTDSVPSLLELVYIKNVKLRLVTDSAFKDPYQQISFSQPPWRSSSSIVESKMLKLTKPGPMAAALATYTKRNLVRCYPNAGRIESSNYDPTAAWAAGIQIAALNFQTPGVPLWVNQGNFADNGGCGWVLKPKEMLTATPCGDGSAHDASNPRYWNLVVDPFAPADKLTVHIVSAHYLPKPPGANVDRSEIIDPFVELKMFGVEEDADDGKRTKVVQDNGFNPQWKESFDFAVRVPALATLLFVVKDKELFSENIIAQTCVAVRLLRPGYRVLALKSPDGLIVKHAFLFVKIEWKRVP